MHGWGEPGHEGTTRGPYPLKKEKQKMTDTANINVPQAPQGGGPIVSGGGQIRFLGSGPSTDQCANTDSDQAKMNDPCTDNGKVEVSGVSLATIVDADGIHQTRERRMSTPNVSESESDAMTWETVSSRGTEKKLRKRRRSAEEEDDFGDSSPSPEVTPARRGRGRPPTTGQYVGLAKAKAELNKAKQEGLRLEAERQLAVNLEAKQERTRAYFKKNPQAAVRGRDAAAIERTVLDEVDTILEVATKSSNLKGTYVAALKTAAGTLKAAFEELRNRTVPEEMALLIEANKKLTEQMEEMRREMTELRALRAQPPPAPTPAPAAAPALDEVLQIVMVQVGTMISARFEGLEERLLPEKRLRPPLAADRRNTETPESMSDATPKGKGKGKGKSSVPLTKSADPEPAPPTCPNAQTEQWTEVVRRIRKGGRAAAPDRSKASAPLQTQAQQPREAQAPKVPKGKKKEAKLRLPRTAAVVITLKPGAIEKGVTYADVLSEAKSRINLAALEMPPLRLRAAATGARILEVPGESRDAKADSLAEKLREVFQGSTDVQVSRPTTTADLRVSGLDDTVRSDELTEALARAGGCASSAIKAGDIRKGPAGTGTAFIRCPVTAAKRIVADGGRLLVGWVAAQVKLLKARPQRCFRCLVPGHMRAQCKSEVDRSEECYRCGQTGHKAATCSAAPHCTVCAASNKPADHPTGGKACVKPPSKRGKKKKKPAATEVNAQSQPAGPEGVEVVMEVN